MESKNNLPIIPFASQQEWETWLAADHTSSGGLWIKFAKKNSGIASISYAEALEVALCYGWIDGQKASYDDVYYLLRFTPRRPKSKWSQINREKATNLIAQGKMQPAGLKEVEAAKQDGRWDAAYAGQRTMTVPDDLQQQLEVNPQAKAFFDSLNSANRYAILYQIHDAKKPETRARRIARYIAMLNEGKKPY